MERNSHLTNTDMIAVLRAAPVLATYEARRKDLDDAQQERAFEVMADSLEAAGATEIVRKMQGDRRYFQAWADLLTILRDSPDMWSPEDGNNIPISFMSADFESVIWAQIDMILLAEKNANQKAVDVDAARPAENQDLNRLQRAPCPWPGIGHSEVVSGRHFS